MIKRLFFLTLLFLMMGCKSIPISNETQIKTTESIGLGIIGEDKLYILEEDYNSIAIPIYKEQIKINASLLDFNKSSFNAFKKANSSKVESLQIAYTDSLHKKLKFLKLEIADRVAVLNALNDSYNKDVKDYIHNKKDAHIISAISLAIDDIKMKAITEADALFLEQNGKKNYIIRAYKNKQLTMSLKFSEGVVFAYQASNFCWQENEKHQLDIVDIVESTDKCPNKTYRSAKRAKKEIDYFKF